MTQDLYYVESGYLTPDSGYYVYTADAESLQASSATMTVTAGVIKDCVSTIVCQTTVAAVISHIHGADLVAFSNAAIATEINVIRTTNVQLTSVFSAAIDGSRGIYVNAQADSSVNLDISNLRVRYSEAASSAAFSLAADGNVIAGVIIKEAEANLSSEFTQTTSVSRRYQLESSQVALASQSTTAERVRDTNVDINSQATFAAIVGKIIESANSISSEFISTANASRTRDVSIDVSTAFTPTLTVDVVKNSFAVLDSTTSLVVQPTSIKIANVTTSSQFTQVAVVGKDIRGNAALNAYTNLLASRNIARSRPVLLTDDNIAFSSTSKYGSHSLRLGSTSFVNDNLDMEIPANTDFLIEFWVNLNNGSVSASSNNLLVTGVGDMTTLANMNANDSWAIGWAGNFPSGSNTRLTFKFATASNTFTTIQTGEGAYTANGWNHIVVTRVGSSIRVRNNTTGDSASATYSGAIFQGTYKKLILDSPFAFDLLIDEFNFKIGYSNGNNGDTASAQAVNDPDKNVFLYHFNNNLVDDTSVTFNQAAALTSTTNVSATISGSQRTSATLVSQSSLSAQINKTGEINLTAFSDANVSTNANRIRSFAAEQSSEFTQSTDVVRIRLASSTQATEFAQIANVVKTVDSLITTDAIFSELIAIARIGQGIVQLDATASLSIVAVKTTDITLTANSAFTHVINAVKIIETNVSLSVNAAIEANNTRIRNQELIYSSNAQLTANAVEIVQIAANLTAVSNLLAETGGIREAFADLSSQASVAATILRIKDASSSLVSEFTQTANTLNSKTLSASATLAAEATVTANVGTIKQSAITTDAIFTELVAVAKTGQGFITLDSPATLSAVITKTSGASADIASQATAVVTVGKLQTANAAMSAVAAFTASGTFVTLANAHINVTASLTCNVVKTASAISLEASAGTLSASPVVIKRTSISMSALAFELAVGSRIQRSQANLVSASTMVARIGGTFGFRSTMQGFTGKLVVADIIHIDAKLTWMIFADDRDYPIQADNRVYSIVREDRDYMIVQEDREHAVTRELLTTQLQGV